MAFTSEQAAELINYGKACLAKNDPGEAMGTFSKVLQADPKNSEALELLISVQMSTGHIDLAFPLIQMGLKEHPQITNFRVLQGTWLMGTDQYDRAIEQYELARQLDPENHIISYNMGLCYRHLGQLEKAAYFVTTSLRLNFSFEKAHYEMSRLLILTGHEQAAVRELIFSILVNPGFIPGYVTLGAYFENKGEVDVAIHLYEIGLKSVPQALALHALIAQAYARKGNFGRACDEVLKVIRHHADWPDYLILGQYALQNQDFDLAQKSFEDALKLNEGAWEAYFNLGLVFEATEDPEKARQMYEMASDLAPVADFRPLNNIGLLDMQKQEFEHAVDYFEVANRVDPSAAEPLFNMSLCMMKLGKTQEAQMYARQVMARTQAQDNLYKQAEEILRMTA